MHMTVNELDRVIEEVVRPHAVQVDVTGQFPKESLRCLAASGVMGLPMAESAGGGGGDLAEAVTVIRKLAGACGSTAMIVLMHYTAAAVIDRYRPRRGQKGDRGRRAPHHPGLLRVGLSEPVLGPIGNGDGLGAWPGTPRRPQRAGSPRGRGGHLRVVEPAARRRGSHDPLVGSG